MIPKIRSNALSKATSFCMSGEDGVRAVSRLRPSLGSPLLLDSYKNCRDQISPLRTASLLSSKIATSLETPNGAVCTHSCVRSGRADDIAEISCKE